MTGTFERFGTDDVRALLAEYPLAWMAAADGRAAHAALLPLMGDFDGSGTLLELVGHMSRHTPLCRALFADPRVLLLFNGPQAYVSPDHAGRRDWAPTWNFAQLRIEAEVTFYPRETDAAVGRLVGMMEDGRATPWHSGELGRRYEGLAQAIVGFRARVTGLCGRFKLGQDETDETLRAIVACHPDPELVRWMRRMNANRL